jgi:FMN-binding protein
MKRNVLWLLSTITVVVLLFGYHTSTSGALSAGSGTVVSSPTQPGRASAASGQGGAGSGGSGSGNGTGGSTATTPTTVTGGIAQTQWGPVQVQLTLKGSTITDVTMLQYPSGNPQDDQINSYALPILIQDTLDAQSAQIDMVSGATVTSVGYVQSLQSALDQAGL